MTGEDNRFESDHERALPDEHELPAGWEASTADLEEVLAGSEKRAGESWPGQCRPKARRAGVAEPRSEGLERSLEDAEERAVDAIVRLADLGQEAEVLRAELEAWNALAAEQERWHA